MHRAARTARFALKLARNPIWHNGTFASQSNQHQSSTDRNQHSEQLNTTTFFFENLIGKQRCNNRRGGDYSSSDSNTSQIDSHQNVIQSKPLKIPITANDLQDFPVMIDALIFRATIVKRKCKPLSTAPPSEHQRHRHGQRLKNDISQPKHCGS